MKIDVKQQIRLGINNSQPNFVPISVKLPENPPQQKQKISIPITVIPKKEPTKEVIQLPKITEPPKQTYGVIHNEQPVIKQEPLKEINKDSILDQIDTGFGDENTLHKECPQPQWHSHLCKENFLSEFKTEIEKQLARDNLNVYSKIQIDQFIKDITNVDTSSFITRDEVTNMIQDLDFVKSTLKSQIDYNIPENLFNL